MSAEQKTRWDEGHDTRKAGIDPSTTGKVMAIIKAQNAAGVYPTTRELANLLNGLPADDKTSNTGFQDSLLQSVLNPLAKQGKVASKYWKQNQKIWAIV